MLKDKLARERAIDPRHSFIVQAPAGSGKTGLITQRYLNLLTTAELPEEVLAITFTRKAANEMKERILHAIQSAAGPAPTSEHEQLTWQIAVKVRQRSQQKHWDLINNPARLRIQTIDSLCASLVKQMPLLAKFGAQPGIEDNAELMYQNAVTQFLEHVLYDREFPDVESQVLHLLKGVNGQVPTLIELLKTLLAKRDQWIRHFVADERLLNKEQLETALALFIGEKLNAIESIAPKEVGRQLCSLAKALVANPVELTDGSPLFVLAEFDGWPSCDTDSLVMWRAASQFLLKSDGALRKRWTKNEGFLSLSAAKGKEEKSLAQEQKEQIEQIVETLCDYSTFVESLAELLELPEPKFTEHQWQTINALNQTLKILLGYLKVEFQTRGKVDFIELSLAALHALEDQTGPTDLAMRLDYQINHILVDEFQDTSHGQFELLKRLTLGWQPNDGRTLFVVGDPMQSIYRFREADVGLYLSCRREGLGDVFLESLQLTTNFRSTAGIVNWVNRAFKQVFPQQEDAMLGAVPVSLADTLSSDDSAAVEFHHEFMQTDEQQAESMLNVIKDIRSSTKDESIAVLVRNKAHAQQIIRRLQDHGIAVEAIEMERLNARPMIKNLRNLTRLLINPADNLALAGLLRSELCGASLRSLHVLLGRYASGWEALRNAYKQNECENFKALGDQERLCGFVERLLPIVNDIQRQPLNQLVQAAWYALGGAQLNASVRDQKDAEQFFAALEIHLADKMIEHVADIDALIERLFSAPTHQGKSQSVKVMSIHKSKGLEFDHVLVPHLEKQSRSETSQLVLWQELPEHFAPNDFLVAPMKYKDADADKIYQLLKKINDRKLLLENGRLLYVAVTRAKRKLHLFATTKVTVRKDDFHVSSPHPSSLLSQMWPVVESSVQAQLTSYDEISETDDLDEAMPASFSRLSSYEVISPMAPVLPPSILDTTLSSENNADEPNDSDSKATLIGVLVHDYLQQIAEEGIEHWNEQKVLSQKALMQQYFRQQMMVDSEIPDCVNRTVKALINTLNDQNGQWILDQHEQARSELALSLKEEQKYATYIIDRTFVENGVRWIIDFKTSEFQQDNLNQSFEHEKANYREQLKNYATLFRKQETLPVRCALYYPMHQALIVYHEDLIGGGE